MSDNQKSNINGRLSKKIDFSVIIKVKNANPNGDPLNGNMPRSNYGEIGEISDVCIKRKMRDRLQEKGQCIFVQSDDRKIDDAKDLKERAERGLGKKITSSKETIVKACEKWFDVRAFGQLFAFKKEKEEDEKGAGVSMAIRGPVSIFPAFSVAPITITSTQITKSVSGEQGKGGKRGSDTMGMKYRVDEGVYVFFGSMNPQLSERTGFSDQDAALIKEILPKLFENDASSARPEGSMSVHKLIWWEHNCKSGQYSSAKVHGLLRVNPDASYELGSLDGLQAEEIDGF